MKWLIALYKAILAFFGSIKADNVKEQQESQQIQDDIVQETQDEIENIPNATDDDLTDVVIDTGLVVPAQNSSGTSNSDRNTHTDCYGRCASPTKTKQ